MPLHVVQPVGQTHALETQILPAVHTVPHAPQFAPSVFGSTHTPLHVIVPVLQVHVPLMQSSPVEQPLPHAPQFS